MKVKQLEFTAVIPTGQFANLQPKITVALDNKDKIDDVRKAAISFINNMVEQYSLDGKPLSTKVETQTLKSLINGEEAKFDPINHNYYDKAGNKLTSGSYWAQSFTKSFDKTMMLPTTAKAWGVDEKVLDEMWRLKGEVSSDFGNAIHKAIDLRGRFEEEGKKSKTQDGHLVGNPIVKLLVDDLFKKFTIGEAMYEVFVVDLTSKLCGQIDRLFILDQAKKLCRVQDFKTSGSLDKKGSPVVIKEFDMPNTEVNRYWLQLSFYAHILKLNGWKVEGLDIFHLGADSWSKISHEVIDISKQLKGTK